jgi:limonene-1,2-epoxide hydrolase
VAGVTAANVAEAFCRHHFSETYPFLHDDIEWEVVGAETIRGKGAVIARCEQSAADLARLSTTFNEFRVIEGDGHAVVESRADYDGADGTFRVASCDLFDFVGGRVRTITSFMVELAADGLDDPIERPEPPDRSGAKL